MTTPEKTVEEIAEDLLSDIQVKGNCGCGGYIDYDDELPKVIQAFQAERQKQEEVVEAERERICNDLDEMWSSLYGAYLNNQDLRELIKNVVTQPNNK